MIFNSLQYAIFLPIVFLLYWLIPWKKRWPLLLLVSYYFYMSWNIKYVVLILFTTILSYFAGISIEKAGDNDRKKKIILIITLIACLGVLFTFKYYNFFFDNINVLLQMFSIPLHISTLKLLLPVGISFYTFQTLSYVIDVYRKRIPAERNLGVYAAFISFFPQLVAGPIERSTNLLPQIKDNRSFSYENASYGLKLMAWGFFKKLAIADVVATYVDTAYSSLSNMSGFDLILAIFLFTIQIYCDFSGYSDIAIGSAKILNIDLMTNFRSPYFSSSIREFWGRWHISLSTWFRDYVYIPLGGNRCTKIRNIGNLMITFFVSGLWHGANWTYVIWGGIHGLAQVLERLIGLDRAKGNSRIISVLKGFFVFCFCNLAWVLFRAESMHDALYIYSHLLDGIKIPSQFFKNHLGMENIEILLVFGTILILAIYDFFSLKVDVIKKISERPIIFRWFVYVLLILIILVRMPSTSGTEFIYFQF